jgi:FdhE protein
VSYATLRSEWADLLVRRPDFREPLGPYGSILESWAAWPGAPVPPLGWDADACRERWRRGVPLLADAPPALTREALEDLVAPVLESLAAVGEEPEALQRFAEAWDRGGVTPSALFPGPGRLASVALQTATGLSQEGLGFLAYASLRPIFEAYFAGCRPHVGGGTWELGVCPLCGAPPGFADIGEGGQRLLACHACGTRWPFSRLTCPYCGSRRPEEVMRLQAEDKDEGYVIAACTGCRGYLKELDRRLRFNAGSALVEDWGSPHLDLVAQRKEYWRAVPTLVH